MMHFTGFKSKAALKQHLKDAAAAGEPVYAEDHFVETSFFGPEYKGAGTYCVCMDHPKRTKFANITVNADGHITGVK